MFPGTPYRMPLPRLAPGRKALGSSARGHNARTDEPDAPGFLNVFSGRRVSKRKIKSEREGDIERGESVTLKFCFDSQRQLVEAHAVESDCRIQERKRYAAKTLLRAGATPWFPHPCGPNPCGLRGSLPP